MLSHRRLYTALLGPDGSARVMVYLQRRMTIAIHVNRTLSQGESGTHRDDPLEAPLDVVASFAAGALLGVLIDWLGRECPGDPQSMAAETLALMATVVTE